MAGKDRMDFAANEEFECFQTESALPAHPLEEMC